MPLRRSALPVLALALALCLSGCSLIFGERTPPTEDGAPAEATAAPALPSPPVPREQAPYPDVPVYFDGLLTDRGYLLEDSLYLSPEAICAFFGQELKLTVSPDGALLTGDGLELYAITGLEYIRANSRYLYTPLGTFLADGRLYLPADAVERMLNVHAVYSPEENRVEIAGNGVSFLPGGEDYYERSFSEEELYWLPHIINAESKDEPLAGMIGVGNVVLSRVKSDRFPDTVYGVIYDRDFAVQFEPILGGGVLEEPEELPVIASRLVLEGYNTVGDSLFFVNPDKGVSPWFEEDLTPTVTIGLHHFYVN